MKRVNIYVDEGVWESVREVAHSISTAQKKISMGAYLTGLHADNLLKIDGQKMLDAQNSAKPKVEIDEQGDIVTTDGEKIENLEEKEKTDPAQKAQNDLDELTKNDESQPEKKPKKEPKRTKHGNCVDCGALHGHRADCPGVVK